jgi:hypothetical protein
MTRCLRMLLVGAVAAVAGCATLGLTVLAPRFEASGEQASEFRLLGPSLQRPLGGVSVRLYARVENPNPVGITLSRLVGTLQLEGFDAADADLPLGLPLEANQVSVVPIDIAVSFTNLPELADVVSRAVTAGRMDYALRGRVTVDAGSFGQPTFGPMTLLEGTVNASR